MGSQLLIHRSSLTKIADVNIQDDETMVSFDVVSLFTAIPVGKACDYIRKKLEDDLSLYSRTNLDIEDIISLLNFVLSNNFFVYNDTIYKQIHGCAMGSPVSPVVANLCMEEIEKTAINTTTVLPKFWKRYVDDSFCIIKSDAVAFFHDSLNSIDQHISFTIEHESNGQLPFLDTLISRDNGKLLVDIYRKPTHTDRYLYFHSHHDRKHKISTAETLLHRALNLPNTQVGKTCETARVCAALHSNGYPKKIAADVIRKKARPPPPTPTPEELVGMFFKWTEPTNRRNCAVLPYIKGITEPLTRILKEHNIQVTSRPVKTLQQHFPIPKLRPAEDDQCNVIYKIPCASCPCSYIGETKRSFTTRRKEHMRNLKHCTKGSNVTKHAWTFNHDIDFNNSKMIDKANNRSRKTLESWHMAKTVGADNNSCPLPRQYHILLKKH
ncbi:uncharacterized protein [Montipora capricornis]|uniref:uncharacterized protein n=1 Tax=Montipora capricornis TaxID=246305 RepID=UPI0035F1CC83